MKKLHLVLLLFILAFSQVAFTQSNPRANIDYDTVELNTTLNVDAPGVLDNDNGDREAITVTAFFVNETEYSAGTTATTDGGSITINTDGSYVFVPTSGYIGNVNTIRYIISNGRATSDADLVLTVERITNLLEYPEDLISRNQGYAVDGTYKINYSFSLQNRSNANDAHENNLIRNINPTCNLDAIFGAGCVIEVNNISIVTSNEFNYATESDFPQDFDFDSINENFINGTSSQIFTNSTITNAILYPRQTINFQFCITINPNCGGRTVPTPSGSGVDFNTIINTASTIGDVTTTYNVTTSLELTDFHTTEAIVSAGLYVPEADPTVSPDGAYRYVNTVTITNEGTATANNVNYNMGLGSFENFYENRNIYNNIEITQKSGPTVTINNDFNGIDNSLLLTAGNTLAANETIILEVKTVTEVFLGGSGSFVQARISQTQGGLDSYIEDDESEITSYVIWSDDLGNHIDRYYLIDSATETASSLSQCSWDVSTMTFSFTSSSSTVINSTINKSPDGILEHDEITFSITISNTSETVDLENLQLKNYINNCDDNNILEVSKPTILTSTATTDPVLNTNYDGIFDSNIFDGTSGLLKTGEAITIQITVLYKEDCMSTNTSIFTASDPLYSNTSPIVRNVESQISTGVSVFSDTDNDGISNVVDIDDDNDTIPDIEEYGGRNPLEDDDNDDIPNYRDTDYGTDANNDGIVDLFDFDNDGVANHLDLDSDNDGILDIIEAGNATNHNNGKTNNSVGTNGLDDTLENNDSANATIIYTLPNTDTDALLNFLDIDADADGIVDYIEAQPTANFIPAAGNVNANGIDTAYPNGITPVDTEGDGIEDYIDTNADDDARDDAVEGWDTNDDTIADTLPANTDIDNDGLDDAYDTDITSVNPTNGQVPTDFPNLDNVENSERDWREIIAIVVHIDDVSVTEGNDLTFTITLTKKNNASIIVQSNTDITIDFTTLDGANTTNLYDVATAPFDFSQINTTVVIPRFTDGPQITIPSLDDNIYEQVEYFTIQGNITTNNTVNTTLQGIGELMDDEEKPSISMTDAFTDEGQPLEPLIRISHPSSTPVVVHVTTSDISAVSPEDYTHFSENITINGTIDPNNANLENTASINTLNDNLNESDEELLKITGTVTSTNISDQDLLKIGTIVDIDPYPIVQINDVSVVEGEILEFSILLLNPNLEPIQSDFPVPLQVTTLDQTTTAGLDYNQIDTKIYVPAFNTIIQQNVSTVDDRLNENTETVILKVTTTDTSASNIYSSTGIGTINDNDFPNLFSPNGDGRGDLFKLLGIEDFPNFSLKIIDRWGSEVYNYNNNGKINPIWWDGTRNGKPVPEGVYYYTLDFNDGKRVPKTSFIELIR